MRRSFHSQCQQQNPRQYWGWVGPRKYREGAFNPTWKYQSEVYSSNVYTTENYQVVSIPFCKAALSGSRSQWFSTNRVISLRRTKQSGSYPVGMRNCSWFENADYSLSELPQGSGGHWIVESSEHLQAIWQAVNVEIQAPWWDSPSFPPALARHLGILLCHQVSLNVLIPLQQELCLPWTEPNWMF